MALTDNPMSLVITSDVTVSATLEVTSIANGTLNLKIGEYYITNELSDDIEYISLYGYHTSYGMRGSITNNTTGLTFRTLLVEDVSYELGNGGDPHTQANVSVIGDYSNHKIIIYDTASNAVLFPETSLSYYSKGSYSYATVYTGDLINLLMNNIGKTISLKIVIK